MAGGYYSQLRIGVIDLCQVEHFNRTIEAIIRKSCEEEPEGLGSTLKVLFAYQKKKLR